VIKLASIAVRNLIHRVVGHTCGIGRAAHLIERTKAKASIGISHFLLLKAKGLKQ
jgi:hypothetical protein